MRTLSPFLLLFPAMVFAVPLNDNVLFAFEKCKSLGVDLEKGQLKESVAPAFDLHCMKVKDDASALKCYYFDPGKNKKTGEEIFTGGSELGAAELKDKAGTKIKFLIGKTYASFESFADHKVCIGIYIFEQDAIKKKTKK